MVVHGILESVGSEAGEVLVVVMPSKGTRWRDEVWPAYKEASVWVSCDGVARCACCWHGSGWMGVAAVVVWCCCRACVGAAKACLYACQLGSQPGRCHMATCGARSLC